MKKPQYISIIIAVATLVLLLAFGRTVPKHNQKAIAQKDDHPSNDPAHKHDESATFSIDSFLTAYKKNLSPDQATRLQLLENSITRGDVKKQKIEVYHQLAHFWKDTAQSFIPYAWYTAESARLENSEKNLNFAAHLLLDQLQQQDNPQLTQWMALQAKDLFERSLTLNANNDSTKVGLGATCLYGGIGTPMEGIGKIREVADRDSANIYAQMTLATASLISGQSDKALQRLQTVIKLQPQHLQAILMLGDIYEKNNDNANAIEWYTKALHYVQRKDLKEELEKRIATLKR